MKQYKRILRRAAASAGKFLAFLAAMIGMSATALGAEIGSIAWEPGSDTPVLQIRLTGEAAYQTETLEDGQRLRISFPDSTMGPSLTELQGMDKVKGVYPYLAENGKSVVIDLLMTEPGQLDVQKAAYGYRVVASAMKPPASTAGSADAGKAPEAMPGASAPAVPAVATDEKPAAAAPAAAAHDPPAPCKASSCAGCGRADGK